MTRVPYFPFKNKDLISPKEQQQEQKWSEFFQKKKSETQKQEVMSKDWRSDHNVDFNLIKITSSFVVSIQCNRNTRNQLTIETY